MLKGLARRCLIIALAILAAAPARPQGQNRTAPTAPVIVTLPVAVSQVLPVNIDRSISIPSNAALELPGQIPNLPPSSLAPEVQAMIQAETPAAPIETPAIIQKNEARAQALLDRTALKRDGQQEKPAGVGDSHWTAVFDGLSARTGKTADLPRVSVSQAPAAKSYLAETRGLGGAELVSKLHELSGRGAKIKHYDEAKSYMFDKADHVERGGKTGLVDAYSGIFVPGTGSDGGAYKERGDQNHDGYIDSGGMNVEHVWPQSFFNKAEPMRADLHHLMATFMHPNGERGNLPFGEVKGRPEYHNDAGAKMGGGVFEPPDLAKGRVARSLLYFYTRYYDKRIFSGNFNQGFWDEKLPMLLRWNREHPPDDFERARNDAVESFQGNRNPFVDDHTLADRIGETAFKTGNRYGVRRGSANYGLTAAAPVLQPEHVVVGARMRPTPNKLGRPLRLIITGPPGAGKGTFSEKISAEYGVPHISVGELLREHAKTHPAVAAVMAKGKLVDTSLVLAVVRERLKQPDVRSRGFILDGFPRRPVEAEALSQLLGPGGVDGVISLDVPDEELLSRILARGRADDSPAVFQERMKIYREQTVPAVETFAKAAPVLAPEVKGHDIATNYARVKAALEDLIKNLAPRKKF